MWHPTCSTERIPLFTLSYRDDAIGLWALWLATLSYRDDDIGLWVLWLAPCWNLSKSTCQVFRKKPPMLPWPRPAKHRRGRGLRRWKGHYTQMYKIWSQIASNLKVDTLITTGCHTVALYVKHNVITKMDFTARLIINMPYNLWYREPGDKHEYWR